MSGLVEAAVKFLDIIIFYVHSSTRYNGETCKLVDVLDDFLKDRVDDVGLTTIPMSEHSNCHYEPTSYVSCYEDVPAILFT